MSDILRLKSLWLLLFAIVLIWQIVSVNLGQHVASLPPEDVERWQQSSSALALQRGIEKMQTSPVSAYEEAMKNAWKWPTDPRHFLLLAMMLEDQDNITAASDLMEALHRLYPRRPDVQLQLGYYWARQGIVRKAVTHWGAAIDMRSSVSGELYPELLGIAEIPAYRQEFGYAFTQAGAWTERFFLYAVKSATELDTLQVLYHSRIKSRQSPTIAMQQSYLNRLIQQQAWTEAYFVWVNSLDAQALARLGNVFDGGFEVESPEQGFAWRYHRNDSLRLQAVPTVGASGKRALHVSFLGTHRQKNRIISQQLLLEPGQYQLRGKYKVENLAALNGLRWELHCPGNKAPIYKTPYFIDKTTWKTFAEPFIVPEGCEAPSLNLMLDPADARRNNLTGSIWFDDLSISYRLPGR